MAEAVAKLMVLSADERAQLQAEAREKWLWDEASRKRQYMREGHAEGLAEGLTKGEAKGMTKSKFEIARRMLKAKMPLSEIMELTGLSKADIERL